MRSRRSTSRRGGGGAMRCRMGSGRRSPSWLFRDPVEDSEGQPFVEPADRRAEGKADEGSRRHVGEDDAEEGLPGEAERPTPMKIPQEREQGCDHRETDAE